MSVCCRGLDAIIGANIIGAYDIGAAQLQMNTLKQVPVSVAQALLKGGQQAIAHAQSVADAQNLPGSTARSNVFWKLQWHQDNLAKFASLPTAIYPSGDDLKKYVMASYVEENAVEEGSAWLSDSWDRMWTEIGHAIAALPAKVATVVHQEVASVAESAFGFPLWAIGTVIGIVVIGLGYVGVKSFSSSLARR